MCLLAQERSANHAHHRGPLKSSLERDHGLVHSLDAQVYPSKQGLMVFLQF